MKTPAQKYLAAVERRPAKSESHLQRAIVQWCRGMGAGMVNERFCSIPNGWYAGGATVTARAIQGAKLKAEGARAGMVDLLFWGCRNISGQVVPTMLWMEVKLGTGGVVSQVQRAVHDSLRENGHTLVVARNLADAVRAIISFYRGS